MIGVFDSGVGGLSAFLPLSRLLPHADLLYYADTAALPLGERTDKEIRARLFAALTFFERRGVEGVLLACGTASALLSEECKERFTFPILDIISPTANAVCALPKGGRTLLLATQAAVRSGGFASRLAYAASPVFSLPCPALVRIAEGSARRYETVDRVLAPADCLAPTSVVLGCTHFSLLKEKIAAHFPHARIFDAALCGASFACSRFSDSGSGTRSFFVTGDPATFAQKAKAILPYPIKPDKIRP